MRKRCDEIIVYAAQNEKKGWTEKEMRLQVQPMPYMNNGIIQSGDYYAATNGEIVPILIERKTVADLYQTLMKSKNRQRFYRAIERYKADDRFDQKIIIVEGTMDEFMKYRHIENIKKDTYGASANSRRASIASLFVRGIPVLFAGTRYNAIQMFKDLVRQKCLKNVEGNHDD